MLKKIKKFLRYNFGVPKDNGKWYKLIGVYFNPSTGEWVGQWDDTKAMKREDI